MIVFTIIGIIVVTLIALWLVFEYCKMGSIDDDTGFILSIFGFGFVYSEPYTVLNQNLNQLRKTEGKKWFILAPSWFNKYVANIGSVRK